MAPPPATNRNVWLRVADLFLENEEGSRDWIKVPELRRAWYLVCGLGIIAGVFAVSTPVFRPLIGSTESATLTFRLAASTLIILLIFGEIYLSFLYFRFALNRRVAIRLGTILNFYFSITFLFGLLHYFLYTIYPDSYLYDHPQAVVLSKLSTGADWWPHLKMKSEFFLFSAFQTINGSFYKIQPRSTLVSVAAYLQTLYTVSLISLFIAAYVNRKTSGIAPTRHNHD
jgi:hypothetical protein